MDIEQTLGEVTRLYRAITGRDVPASNIPYAPIPAEKDPAQHVEEQLQRLVDVLTSVQRASTAPWAPAVSVYESPVELIVTIDVPGTTRDALDVRTESRFGPFQRAIPLPPGLRTADMTAHVESGVLHVQIPRDSGGGERQVAVE